MQKPRLLLHICCAPCSPHSIDLLKKDFELTAYFYDPNIHPEDEYIFRLDEMRKFSHQIGLTFIPAEYDPDRWFELTKGHEDDREGEGRCEICFKKRDGFKISVQKGKEYGLKRQNYCGCVFSKKAD